MGRKAVFAFKFFLIIFSLGCCVAYVIFFVEFFEIAFRTEKEKNDRIIYLLISLFVIVPMSLINNYHFFHKWSKIANILSIIVFIAILELALEKIFFNDIKDNEKDIANFSKIPAFIGIAIFSFESVGHISVVRNSM